MKPLPFFYAALLLLGIAGWWLRPNQQPANEARAVDPRPRPKSPAERLRDAMRDTDRGRRSERFATIWNGMTAEQPGLANAIAFQIVQNQPDTGKALVEACLGRATPPTALEISLFNNFAREMPIDWLSQVKELFPVPPILLERLAKEWFLHMVEPRTGLVLEDPWSLEILKPVDQLFQHWVAGDPKDASRWLTGQETTPRRDKFVRTLINSMMNEDPEGARQWLASLSQESRVAFYRQWTLTNQHRIDPELEEMMKRDGFNHRGDTSIILRELENEDTQQSDPTE